jgi:hypothetical protein
MHSLLWMHTLRCNRRSYLCVHTWFTLLTQESLHVFNVNFFLFAQLFLNKFFTFPTIFSFSEAHRQHELTLISARGDNFSSLRNFVLKFFHFSLWNWNKLICWTQNQIPSARYKYFSKYKCVYNTNTINISGHDD